MRFAIRHDTLFRAHAFGVAVTDGHVALRAAPDQIGTMPIEGGYWGDGVTSELGFGLEIEVG